jgi:hypothetical protein
MSFASVIAKTWLTETISALPEVAALGANKVWERKAPPEIASPFVVFTRIHAADISPIGGPVVASNVHYQWAVVMDGKDDTPITAAANAIDAATDGIDTEFQGHALTSQRLQEIPTDEPTEEGKEAVWLGGVIEIFVAAQ